MFLFPYLGDIFQDIVDIVCRRVDSSLVKQLAGRNTGGLLLGSFIYTSHI